MEKLDVVIIGAGAEGLAIAAEIARKDREIYILEKETTYGQGTSSPAIASMVGRMVENYL